ncbi:MAG: matrixin family metalloprotease [Nitrosarchaeum sp.]
MGNALIFVLLLLLIPNIAFAETLETFVFLPWILDSHKTLYVMVNSSSDISSTKQQIIQDVILSKKQFTVDNKIYFKGWQGALDQINYFDNIPIKIVFTDDFRKSNLISIDLNDRLSNYDGFTKFELHHNKIITSNITIYNFKNLSDSEFEKILQHEFGHSLGLAHSNDVEDIMYGVLPMTNPYISYDNVSALDRLY